MALTSEPVALPPPLPAGAPERRHIPELDGLRGLAILQVVLFHLTMNTRISTAFGWRVVGNLMAVFPSGVELFFVLSGFLITGILLEAKEAGGAYFRPFYARRFLRIFPLYYGLLLAVFVPLSILVLLHHVPAGEYFDLYHRQGWLWSYATNFWLGTTKDKPGTSQIWFGHFWSLALEEQFYLFWPLCVLLCRPITLIRICIGGFALMFAGRVYCVIHGHPWFSFYVLRADGLFAGALIAAAVTIGFEPSHHRAAAVRAGWGLLLLTPLFTATPLLAAAMPAAAKPFEIVSEFAPAHAAAIFAALLILALGLGHESTTRASLRLVWLRYLGKISYGLYVYHDFIMPMLVAWLFHGVLLQAIHSPLVIPVFTAIGFFISVAIAAASWHAFEKQALRLKRFFPYGAGR